MDLKETLAAFVDGTENQLTLDPNGNPVESEMLVTAPTLVVRAPTDTLKEVSEGHVVGSPSRAHLGMLMCVMVPRESMDGIDTAIDDVAALIEAIDQWEIIEGDGLGGHPSK